MNFDVIAGWLYGWFLYCSWLSFRRHIKFTRPRDTHSISLGMYAIMTLGFSCADLRNFDLRLPMNLANWHWINSQHFQFSYNFSEYY
jgi:uncharacterized protein with PQ loop repeat